MYPNLSYLFHDLFGTAPDNGFAVIQMFGLFLALAFFSAAFLLFLELKRKENDGIFHPTVEKVTMGQPATPLEIILNGILGFLLGFKALYIFQNFEEFKIGAPDVILSSKGNIIGGIVGAILFALYKYWEKASERLDNPQVRELNIYPSDKTGDITIWAAVTGLLGAKILALIETPDRFMDDPLGQLFSGSGLAIYGGLIGGFFGVAFYLWKNKIAFWHFADAVAPALMVSYGVGRMGCQFSGDGDWGVPVKAAAGNTFIPEGYDMSTPPGWMSWMPDWVWSYTYPHNVNRDGIKMDNCDWLYCNELPVPVFTTPLWEIVAALTIGAILWSLRKRLKVPGLLFCLYLIFNGLERYWIEGYRVNDKYDWLPFSWTQAELIAVILISLGVVIGGIRWMKYKND